MDQFLYDRDLRHERVKATCEQWTIITKCQKNALVLIYNPFQISVYKIHFQISIATKAFISNNSTAGYEYCMLLKEKAT